MGGTKEEKGIDANVKVGVEYKYKVISMSGEEKEETIFIEPTLTTTTPIINTTTNATSSVGTNSIEKGTTLYINFSATMDITGGTITIKNKDDGNPLPYAVTTNKKYIFVVTGTYGENKTITKEVEVLVNQYKGAQGVVAYDAGDWTESEIQELQTEGLYNLNASKTASTASGLNFTFGGFTHKGDTENSSYINNGTIITSRNQSVAPESGYGTPKYEGWQILESHEENNKTYVTKLVHAGCPENFVYYYTTVYDHFRAEYLLSSGLRQTGYSTFSGGQTINPRSWDMYKDKNQLNLIEEVHCMTYHEALALTGKIWATTGLRNTGSYYWLGSADTSLSDCLKHVDSTGRLNYADDNCWGVRPIITLKSGVYIKSGDGVEDSPYVLGIEQ